MQPWPECFHYKRRGISNVFSFDSISWPYQMTWCIVLGYSCCSDAHQGSFCMHAYSYPGRWGLFFLVFPLCVSWGSGPAKRIDAHGLTCDYVTLTIVCQYLAVVGLMWIHVFDGILYFCCTKELLFFIQMLWSNLPLKSDQVVLLLFAILSYGCGKGVILKSIEHL